MNLLISLMRLFGLGIRPGVYVDPRAGNAVVAFRPNKTSLAIMELIGGYFTKTRKGHNLISQKWILEQLAKYHQAKIARSTLNYNLDILRRQGLIQTVTRHKRDPKSGQFVCQVTLYKMTKKLKSYLYKLAGWFKRIGWVPSLEALKAGYLPVVGEATSKEDAHKAYLEQRRQREWTKRRRRGG